MTQNQIRYAEHLENTRHNKTTEQETGRHNVVTEQQGWQTLGETARHNRQTEAVGWFTAQSAADLNEARIRQGDADVATRRFSAYTERLKLPSIQQQAEAASDQADVAQQRANIEDERTGILQQQADIAQQQADIAAATLNETREHNDVEEAIRIGETIIKGFGTLGSFARDVTSAGGTVTEKLFPFITLPFFK